MVAEPGIHRIEVTTLGDLLDLRAAELGGHLAMVFPDHRVTYAGLAERADFFARGLLAAGLKPGETVGILLPNCADAIAALFGAAKAGLYPVPVNARYKSLELADLIRHSRMRALFISPPDPASPAAPDFPALLAEAFPALAGQDRAALALDSAPDLRQIVVHLFDRAPGAFGQELAGECQPHATRRAIEKAVPEQFFEPFDLLAERRLGDPQALRRLAEMERLRHCEEVPKMT